MTLAHTDHKHTWREYFRLW